MYIFLQILILKMYENGSIQDFCDYFMNTATLISDYTCDRCKNKSRIVESIVDGKLPPFLHILLTRYTQEGKINYPVKVDERLKFKFGDKTQNYVLSGIVEHEGTHLKMGHYVAIVKTREGYMKFDDRTVMNLNLII